MNGKQKRLFNQTTKAISDLSKATIEDPASFNTTLEMLSRAIGTMIGGACAVHGLDTGNLHAATITASRCIQENAAEQYAKYLALEKAHSETRVDQ